MDSFRSLSKFFSGCEARDELCVFSTRERSKSRVDNCRVCARVARKSDEIGGLSSPSGSHKMTAMGCAILLNHAEIFLSIFKRFSHAIALFCCRSASALNIEFLITLLWSFVVEYVKLFGYFFLFSFPCMFAFCQYKQMPTSRARMWINIWKSWVKREKNRVLCVYDWTTSGILSMLELLRMQRKNFGFFISLL